MGDARERIVLCLDCSFQHLERIALTAPLRSSCFCFALNACVGSKYATMCGRYACFCVSVGGSRAFVHVFCLYKGEQTRMQQYQRFCATPRPFSLWSDVP